MGKRSTEAETTEWDEERVMLRIRLHLAVERGASMSDQRVMAERIALLDGLIKEARGFKKANPKPDQFQE